MTIEQLDMSSLVLLCLGVLGVAFLIYRRNVDRLKIRVREMVAQKDRDDHLIRNLQQNIANDKVLLAKAHERIEELAEYCLADPKPDHVPDDVRRYVRRRTPITTTRHG